MGKGELAFWIGLVYVFGMISGILTTLCWMNLFF